MTVIESLKVSLSADELARVNAMLAKAARSSTFATWLAGRGAVLVGAVLDGELAGWLIAPAIDEAEGRVLGESIADGLAALYDSMRAARAAAAEALRKAAH